MGLPDTLPGPLLPPDQSPTPILTARPLVNFRTRQVDPPSDVYVTVDDLIHLRAYTGQANVVVQITYRVLLANGQVMESTDNVVVSGDRLPHDFFFSLAEGFILSLDVRCTNSGMLRGMVWCEVDIATGTPPSTVDTQPLLSDYVLTSHTLGWPGGRQISSIEGPGAILTQVSNPAVGVGSVVFTVPTNSRWHVHSLDASITTDATAGNRQALVSASGSVGVLWESEALAVQAPSLTRRYPTAAFSFQPAIVSNQIPIAGPFPYPLIAGDTLTFTNGGGSAGDQISGVHLRYEEWIEPAN